MTRPNVLIVAGLDPSGGAGLIADIRVCEQLGCRPVAVATALTARDAENALWQRDLAEAELAVGDAARAGGDTGAALDHYRRGETIHAALVAREQMILTPGL